MRWVRGWHLVVDCQPVGSSIAHPRMKTHLWPQPARFLNFITNIIPFSLTCVNPKTGEEVRGLGGELEVEIEKSISCLLNIGRETKIPEKTIFNWENTETPTSTVLSDLLCNKTQKFRIFLLPVRNRDVYAYHGGEYVVNEEQKLWIDRPPFPRQSRALLIYICLIGFGAKWDCLSAGKFEPIVIISYMGGRKPLPSAFQPMLCSPIFSSTARHKQKRKLESTAVRQLRWFHTWGEVKHPAAWQQTQPGTIISFLAMHTSLLRHKYFICWTIMIYIDMHAYEHAN